MKLYTSFGQVFLKDIRYIKKILDALEIEERILVEIGPGIGQITEELLKKAKFVYCVEVDKRFIDILNKKFANIKNVEIIHKDILKFNLSQFDSKIIIFGNIPYQISNFLLKYLIKNRQYIDIAYLTLQKEFAQKLLAKASTKQYSFLSCFIQYYADVEKFFDIPKYAFMPVPSVDSTFIKIKFHTENPCNMEEEKILFGIIRKAFMHRRKKIINSLSVLKERQDLLNLLNIDKNCRAEDLSLKDYINLAKNLCKSSYERYKL